MNYPNPCDTCEQECTYTKGCSDWLIRFYVIWKQFNAYPIRQYKKQKQERTSFVYEHPDILRKYLRESPCGKCKNEQTCDVPCGAYAAWWDARMTVLRRKYHCEERKSDGEEETVLQHDP